MSIAMLCGMLASVILLIVAASIDHLANFLVGCYWSTLSCHVIFGSKRHNANELDYRRLLMHDDSYNIGKVNVVIR